jgi:hypothetical protein
MTNKKQTAATKNDKQKSRQQQRRMTNKKQAAATKNDEQKGRQQQRQEQPQVLRLHHCVAMMLLRMTALTLPREP